MNNKNVNRLKIKLAAQSECFGTPYIHRHHYNLPGRLETLKRLAGGTVSLSRFGDGELMLALLERGISFQPKSRELNDRLRQILQEQDHRVLICINNEFMRNERITWVLRYERSSKDYSAFESLREPNDTGVLYRQKEWTFYNTCFKIMFGRKPPTLFGDATLFMLGLYTDEYRNDRMEMVMDLMRTLFRKKRLLIVAPASPLMNPSFRSLERQLISGGATKVTFIDIPEINAFAHYRAIKLKILKSTGFDSVWVQAGPAASVLAHDLAINHNILAYDIGSFNTTLKYIL